MWRLLAVPVRAYTGIALGRRAPQDLPASHALLVPTYAVYCLVTFLLTLLSDTADVALRAMAVDAAVLPAFTLSVLWLRSRTERWMQTLTALAGIGALFTLLAMPPFAIIAHLGDSPLAGLASIAVLVLFAWNVLAVGHVLRHALSVPFPAAVLAAMAYVAINTFVVGFVVPEVTTG